MNILICGLGLIGASLAKTLKKNTNHTVLGWNRTESVTEKALRDGVIDKRRKVHKYCVLFFF